MPLRYWFLGSENELLFSNSKKTLPDHPELRRGESRGYLEVQAQKFRYVRIHSQGGFIVVIASGECDIAVFDEKVDVLKDFLGHLQEVKNKIIDDILHNVTAIHGHNVQEIFNVIPEGTTFRDFPKQIEDIKDIILRDMPDVALALIQIIRNNKILTAEFNNIRLLHSAKIATKFRKESINKIIQSILYLYCQDFEKKNVRIHHPKNEDMINLDYSLFVGGSYTHL